MIARLIFGTGLALTLALLLAIPDFAPLKQLAPATATQDRLARAGLWRIGLLDAGRADSEVGMLITEELALARVCALPPDGGWPQAGSVRVADVALALMAAESISRPGWRQAGEFVIAEAIEIAGHPPPNMTYGPLQIRASRAEQYAPQLNGLPRAHIIARLDDPCLSVFIAARMVVNALQDSVGEPAAYRVLHAAAEYSGYLGDLENYSYGAIVLRAYERLGEG